MRDDEDGFFNFFVRFCNGKTTDEKSVRVMILHSIMWMRRRKNCKNRLFSTVFWCFLGGCGEENDEKIG
jgi:hypothetical protein